MYKFVELPSAEELKVFLDFAGPIAFALLGKVKPRPLQEVLLSLVIVGWGCCGGFVRRFALRGCFVSSPC